MKYVKPLALGSFLAGLVLLSVGFILDSRNESIVQRRLSCTETHLKIRTTGEFEIYDEEIDVDSVLWEPKDAFDVYEKRPAMVCLHGFAGNKMHYRRVGHELARRGIVGLSITARGHGASGGGFGFASVNETLAAVKWLRDNADEYRIDTSRIGLAGESQGSWSVTLAAISDAEAGNHWIGTTIVMDGPAYETKCEHTSGGFSEIALLQKEWAFPNNYQAMEQEIHDFGLNNSQPSNHTMVPKNYLYILAENDFIYSKLSAKRVLWHYGQEALYGTSDYSDVELDRLYGSFENGTARKIHYVLGAGHGGGMSAFEATINWVENAFSLTEESSFPGDVIPEGNPFEKPYPAGDFTLYGLMLLLLPVVVCLGRFARNEMTTPEAAKALEGKNVVKLFSLYGAIFIGTSALVVPVIKALSLRDLVGIDFLVANVIVLLLFVHALLLLPFLCLLGFLENKHYNEKLKDFGLDADYRSYLKNVVFGAGLFFIIYVTGFLGQVYPAKILRFLEAFAYILFAIGTYSLFVCGFIQTKLTRYEKDNLPVREILYTAGMAAILIGSALSIEFGMFLVDTNVSLDILAFDLNMTIVWLGLVAAMFLLGVVIACLYRQTRNILGPAVLIALLLSAIVNMLPAL